MALPSPLLEVAELHVSFETAHGRFDAVKDVSLQVWPGQVLSIVGESGSGKSTLARTVMGMCRPRAGQVLLRGEVLAPDAARRTMAQRSRLAMVFQDSSAAFDPRFNVSRILQEPLSLAGRALNTTPGQMLDEVGLSAVLLERYPHELSGGQRQRLGIARALACGPELLICDEAVSALDVSVQAQILNLLSELQESRNLAFLFITHDLTVVEYFADHIAVMRQGELLETGPAARVLDKPSHPYTRALLSAVRGTETSPFLNEST